MDQSQPSSFQQKPSDDVLASRVLNLERKVFHISARKNNRGAFLRVIEENGSNRSVVIVPDTGVREFIDALSEIATQANL